MYFAMSLKVLVIKKYRKWKLWQGRKLSTQHELLNPWGIKNGSLIHVRDFNGQNPLQLTVICKVPYATFILPQFQVIIPWAC